MYKGKFDQKSRNSNTDIQDLVAQRNAAPQKSSAPQQPRTPARDAAARPAAPKAAPNGRNPQQPVRQAAPRPAQAQPRPQGQKRPAPQSVQKKGPRLGGTIFYTLYFLFIFIFFLGTFIGLKWLQGWLTDFELSQPDTKAEQVFQQLFTNPDWGALYDASGSQDSPYEGKDAFVAVMQEKIDPTHLSYLATSGGLSGKKYEVRMDNKKVATFTLVDKNNVGDGDLTEMVGKLPDWQLDEVDVFFERDEVYLIEKLDGHVAYVNDVLLDDEQSIIQIATTKAEEYLPVGTTGVSMCTQQVSGLMNIPTVTIFDKEGKQMPVSYNEETRTFTEGLESNTISDAERTVALEAAKTSCKWMIEATRDRGEVAKYFDNTSDAYTNIVSNRELWVQDYSSYEFLNESVKDYVRYTDSLFSCRVSVDLKVVPKNFEEKTFNFDSSMFFRKTETGKWLCYAATNRDVSAPVGKVRLTFMDGKTQLHSDMYLTDAKEIVTPLSSNVPEGKVFDGWYKQETDENGVTTMTLVFQPDSTGTVNVPEGFTLTPMTLYARYVDAGEQTVPEASTPDATAPAEGG